jgi:hypothetical protein
MCTAAALHDDIDIPESRAGIRPVSAHLLSSNNLPADQRTAVTRSLLAAVCAAQGRVISGHVEALEAAEKLALQRGALKATRLAVSGAFHTRLMEPARRALEEVLGQVGNLEALENRCAAVGGNVRLVNSRVVVWLCVLCGCVGVWLCVCVGGGGLGLCRTVGLLLLHPRCPAAAGGHPGATHASVQQRQRAALPL